MATTAYQNEITLEHVHAATARMHELADGDLAALMMANTAALASLKAATDRLQVRAAAMTRRLHVEELRVVAGQLMFRAMLSTRNGDTERAKREHALSQAAGAMADAVEQGGVA
jgi:hypothetical protein